MPASPHERIRAGTSGLMRLLFFNFPPQKRELWDFFSSQISLDILLQHQNKWLGAPGAPRREGAPGAPRRRGTGPLARRLADLARARALGHESEGEMEIEIGGGGGADGLRSSSDCHHHRHRHRHCRLLIFLFLLFRICLLLLCQARSSKPSCVPWSLLERSWSF